MENSSQRKLIKVAISSEVRGKEKKAGLQR